MRVFEDVFSDAQAEMVSLALDCGNSDVSDVCIQFTIYGNMCSGIVFYVVDSHVMALQDLPADDVSRDGRKRLFGDIARKAHSISSACQEYGRPVPIEGYLRYRVAARSLDARYLYDLDPSDEDALIHAAERLDQWKLVIERELLGLDG